jgi:hypothetical protein
MRDESEAQADRKRDAVRANRTTDIEDSARINGSNERKLRCGAESFKFEGEQVGFNQQSPFCYKGARF